MVSQLVELCPEVTVRMAGVAVPCLIDTGSMVSTITEAFFNQHFREKLQPCQWLQLTADNGLDIRYHGYAELDVEVFGRVVHKRGIQFAFRLNFEDGRVVCCVFTLHFIFSFA